MYQTDLKLASTRIICCSEIMCLFPWVNSVRVSFSGELDGQHHVLPCTRAVGAHPDPCSPLFPVLGPVDDVPDQLHKLRILRSPGQARAGRGHTGNRGTCKTFHRGLQSCRLWPPAAVANDHSGSLQDIFLFCSAPSLSCPIPTYLSLGKTSPTEQHHNSLFENLRQYSRICR